MPSPADAAQKLPALIPRQRKQPASEPPPPTPPLPPPPETPTFTVPTRRILSPHDHELFLASPTYTLILAWIFNIADSVRATPASAASSAPHPTLNTILSILSDAQNLITQYPPLDTGSRFGNPQFRPYLAGVTGQLDAWHARLGLPADAVPEVRTYLQHALGSESRIDYGSGHELNFMLWLLCLNRLNLLPESTFPALALVVFPAYLRLVRALQTTYYLEPAGSHGVWGLDDYQFLPFLFGASQLVHHAWITPRAIHSEVTLEEHSRDYLYLDQVRFVNSVKNVEGLRWHSPMLDDISAARDWVKIEAGMRKMFVKEVLGKLPVMQHFLFGSLIPAVDGMSVDTGGEQGGHVHEHENGESAWGDCCGIPVPSSIGAAEEMKKRMGGGGLRRLPFD
ncbi:Phosphotyrosyl phosphatase activator [Trichodelitschia bisporula]|uniref:Serine/threonine-protein phosphatase 2A activator n=1 Tax=Trichodelitschia bisporula TaxID=703511 RepID=A0A6G1HPE9_9PEZI|nr:Phosphotyrosyl phosphatase activator [Trichodelitschia bisporula]